MQQGFVKVAAVTPDIRVADPLYNRESVLKKVKEAAENGAVVIVCPELCLTGYTCNDLFLQELLLRQAKEALVWLMEQTVGLNALIFVGLPFEHLGKLYNVAAAINRGRLLGLVPKTHLPNYGEFYEKRHFTRGMEQMVPVSVTKDVQTCMGTQLIFECEEYPTLRVAAELIDLGADVAPINKIFFDTKTFARLKLEARLTAGIELYAGGMVGLCTLPQRWIDELSISEEGDYHKYDTLDENVDMVIGSRFIEKEGFQSSGMRRVGIRFLSGLTKVLTGKKITDPTSGLRMISREVIELFASDYPKDYPEPESNVLLLRSGKKIIEIPVIMQARETGKSSISPRKSIYYMIKVSLAMIIAGIRRKR